MSNSCGSSILWTLYTPTIPSDQNQGTPHKLRYLQHFSSELNDLDPLLKLGKDVKRQALIDKIASVPWVLETARRVAPLVRDGERIKDDVKYPQDWLLKVRSFASSWTHLRSWARAFKEDEPDPEEVESLKVTDVWVKQGIHKFS